MDALKMETILVDIVGYCALADATNCNQSSYSNHDPYK